MQLGFASFLEFSHLNALRFPLHSQIITDRLFHYYSMTEQTAFHKINLRNKGQKEQTGKVFKGCVKNAFTKLSIGSIPSNYESIVYLQNEKQGFGTSQKRFKTKEKREILLEDNFDQIQEEEPKCIPKHVASQSIKGFGSLIAKDKREWAFAVRTHSPGPGQYFYGKENQNQRSSSKKIKSKGELRYVKRECPKTADSTAMTVPGPGQYETDLRPQKYRVGWKSSFEAKGNRDGYIPKSFTPGPGFYNMKETPEKKTIEKNTLPPAPFSRPLNNFLYETIGRQPTEAPGPGTYNTTLPNFKPIYERIKISSNFMPKCKERSTDLEKKDQFSDEKTYQIPSQFDKCAEKLIDWPCFMSQTRRVIFEDSFKRLGPNLSPQGHENKKNFHFNIKGDWL